MTGIVFVKTGGFWGGLISLFTGSEWNHLAILCGGMVYEVVPHDGMTKTSSFWYRQRYADTAVYEIEADQRDALAWLESQMSVQYDYERSIGWLFRNWIKLGQPERWNCVEHISHFLAYLGVENPIGDRNMEPAEVLSICEQQFRTQYRGRVK